jgi:hypothetical protein
MPGSESRKPQTGSDLLSVPAANGACRAPAANSTGFGGGDPADLNWQTPHFLIVREA